MGALVGAVSCTTPVSNYVELQQTEHLDIELSIFLPHPVTEMISPQKSSLPSSVIKSMEFFDNTKMHAR